MDTSKFNQIHQLSDVDDGKGKKLENGKEIIHPNDTTAILLLENNVECEKSVANRLGEGNFGSLFTGKFILNGQIDDNRVLVAIKFLKLSNAAIRKVLTEEANILSLLRHDNIISMKGIQVSASPYFIVFELASNSLKEALYTHELKGLLRISKTNYKRKAQVLSQCADALHYLHEKKIVHGNIQSASVLLTKDGTVKLAKFGFTKTRNLIVDKSPSSQKVSTWSRVASGPQYLAPEILTDATISTSPPSQASDVYAFGILINEVLDHAPPFPGLTIQNIITRLRRPDNNRPHLFVPRKPDHNPEDLDGTEAIQTLIKQCWNAEVTARPVMSEVLSRLQGISTLVLFAQANHIEEEQYHHDHTEAIVVTIPTFEEIQLSYKNKEKEAAEAVLVTPMRRGSAIKVSALARRFSRTQMNTLVADEEQAATVISPVMLNLKNQDEAVSLEDRPDYGSSSTSSSRSSSFCETTSTSDCPITIEGNIDSTKFLEGRALFPSLQNDEEEKEKEEEKEAASEVIEGGEGELAEVELENVSVVVEETEPIIMISNEVDSVLPEIITVESSTEQAEEEKKIIIEAAPITRVVMSYTNEYSFPAEEIEALYYQAGNCGQRLSCEALIQLAATNPLAEAFFMAMLCYGSGITKNFARAAAIGTRLFPWLQQMSNNTEDTMASMYAQYLTGICYEQGLGTSRNLYQATKFYALSTQQGYGGAQSNLGFCYKHGLGVEKVDLSEAIRLYSLGATQNHAVAQNNLAYCYQHGDGVTLNPDEAVRYFTLSANQGYSAAMYNLAHCYTNGVGVAVDMAKAVHLYQLGADQGCCFAQNTLGHCYKRGLGVAQDLTMAAKYYELSAQQGHCGAQNSIGYCYQNAQGVEKNEVEAVKWYKLSAEQGHAGAQNSLGYCYQHGFGVNKDYDQAAKYYELSAKQNYTTAIYNLGKCYQKGHGKKKDKQEADRLFAIAAERGEPLAVEETKKQSNKFFPSLFSPSRNIKTPPVSSSASANNLNTLSTKGTNSNKSNKQ